MVREAATACVKKALPATAKFLAHRRGSTFRSGPLFALCRRIKEQSLRTWARGVL